MRRINRQAVAKIERGEVIPRVDSILSICQALEVNPSIVFAMADSKP